MHAIQVFYAKALDKSMDLIQKFSWHIFYHLQFYKLWVSHSSAHCLCTATVTTKTNHQTTPFIMLMSIDSRHFSEVLSDNHGIRQGAISLGYKAVEERILSHLDALTIYD